MLLTAEENSIPIPLCRNMSGRHPRRILYGTLILEIVNVYNSEAIFVQENSKCEVIAKD